MKKYILLYAALLSTLCGFSQTISGNLIQLANQEIKLEGFNALKNYPSLVFADGEERMRIMDGMGRMIRDEFAQVENGKKLGEVDLTYVAKGVLCSGNARWKSEDNSCNPALKNCRSVNKKGLSS